ncbi:hypothetical protein [Mobilicoccus massiliensis]|uniref:hypothetical protein n=1 Tax=Mobilicoccus massiliensis TaxID=1522310 RepID=UPI0005903EAF|nr:hypothetical protein [Mobilicoccus massiliensis]
MKSWWKRRADNPSEAMAKKARLEKGDSILAVATDVVTGSIVVASAHELIVLAPDGSEFSRRRWLDVDAGSWENTTGTVSVTWVDGSRGTQWTFGTDEMRFPEAFRDRVEASRVIDAPVVDGDRDLGRAAVRKDLRTGELVPQLVLGRRVRRDDAVAHLIAEQTLAELTEQVGL